MTRGFICEVQPGLILKFNCDPFSPEEDAGNSIPGERNRTVMTECTPVVFAQTVVESLINQIKVKRYKCVSLESKTFYRQKGEFISCKNVNILLYVYLQYNANSGLIIPA